MTGPEFRILRLHLGLTRTQLGAAMRVSIEAVRLACAYLKLDGVEVATSTLSYRTETDLAEWIIKVGTAKHGDLSLEQVEWLLGEDK